MSALPPGVPGFIGQVLDDDGATVGTCWLVAPGWVLTAAHVAQAAGADVVAASVTAERAFSAAADRADERAVTLRLRRGLEKTGPVIEGRVRRADTVIDLALVKIDAESWDSAPAGLADSENVKPKEVVVVTGAAELADAREDAALIASSTTGLWDMGGLRKDSLYLAKIKASGVLPNMSGAPVIRAEDSTVVGLVTSRYNSADGWGRDTVWVVGGRAIEQFCRPVVGSLLPPPPAPTQAVHVVLRPTRETVSLVCEELGISEIAPCRGARGRLFPASERLRLARRDLVEAQRSGKQTPGRQVGEPTPLLDALEEIGSLMGEVFLPGAVGEALTRILTKARSQTVPVEFAVDLTECPELRGLPWEGLRHPEVDGPLALHPLVVFYRLAVASPTPRRVEGPLRIVVAIASPLDGEPQLDYESELRNIVASVREARAGGAEVRIVTFATTAEINKALGAGDVHVLHISCHGSAGRLSLEDENGSARPVTARTLVEEAIPPGKMPPVICLSACDTNVTDPSGDLPAVADELVSSGAPAVIGTETSVSDRYATLVFARVYAELAKATEQPDPATALAAARRQVLRACENSERSRDRGEQVLSGWSVVTIQAASSRKALFDLTTARPSRNDPSPVVSEVGDLPALSPGSFVGRRREQLEIPRFLADEDRGGVVLHGIGGIGKTSLANEILRRVGEQRDGVVFVTLSGAVTAEEILQEIITELKIDAYSQGQLPNPRFLGKLESIGNPHIDWNSRISLLRREFLKRIPIIVVLDNFEDNLQPIQKDDNSHHDGSKNHGRRRIADQRLADFLAALAKTQGPSALLITCRYRFELPDDSGEYLRWWGLGPLSFSETLRLAWDLPHVEALDDYQLHVLWAGIGGHPRTLEMLDALLGHGRGRLARIEQELKQRLKETLPDGMDVDSWLDRPRDLDVSVAEAVTLAANDVLLPQLLDLLNPEAKRLLMGLALFRRPVERSAAAFVLGTFTERDTTANETNDAPDPPFATDLPVDDLLDELVSTTLLTRLQSADGSSAQWFVHRWTASAMERQEELAVETAEEDKVARHRRAAAYWMWHYRTAAQSREADVNDLMECYAHFGEAEDVEQSDDAAQRAANILDLIGRWDDEWRLINRQFQNPRLSKSRQAIWHHQLGVLAQARGDYDTAHDRYQQSLTIFEELGDRANMAKTYHQLGTLAQARGDYDTAHTYYQRALTIFEELGNRAGMATSYHALGVLAQDRGDYNTAHTYYQQSLTIKEELGNRANMAKTYHALGVLAQDRGDYNTAHTYYQRALTIFEELGNRANMAKTYHQLGTLAHDRGDYNTAHTYYQRALTIFEELGNRANMAKTYHQLGTLAHDRGDYDTAHTYYQRALTIFEELDDRAGIAATYHALGVLARARGDYDTAHTYYQRALTIFEELDDRAGIAATYHALGVLAHDQSHYDTAHTYYQRALTIFEELGNRAGMATSYHQLGVLARARGDYDTARTRYQQSLTIEEELGNRAGMAATHHQLGILAQDRGDYDTARTRYQQSLTIEEELGNRAGMATSYHALGVLARARGDYDTAHTYYQQALTIEEELGNRAGIATSYHALGVLARARGDYDTAHTYYQQALTIFEELGNRAGIANTYHQLGVLAHDQSDHDTAHNRYQRALTIFEELGDRAGIANTYGQLGVLAHDQSDHDTARDHYQQALTIFEELGDRVNIAKVRRNLDILAKDQNDT
ncbi:tetratricopeptide repeat protein [Actinomyces sp. oral taxon 414]|uniref:tetratricopeptide repeat protein n=1 Tax=Actinomyces sp. oral taxon 414 TaxID=712122 RepID=UPI0006AF64EC|nr:tetratricopeptide repeat protein [Actinomyces sp. oral taxon 414]